MPFQIVRNDITKMNVDAIVNAANETLLGGGGVDGAIHRAAGPGLLAECRTLGGCRTGEAKITKGYNLPCRHVIHTVGPVWTGGARQEAALLASCYRNALRLAEENRCESVAFPLISAGAYGYPREEAMKIAASTIREFLAEHDMTVYLVVFDRKSFAISERLYADIQAFIDDSYIGPDYELTESRRMFQNAPDAAPMATPRAPASQSAAQEKPRGKLFPWQRRKEADLAGSVHEEFAERTVMADSLNDYLSQLDEGFRDMLLRKIDEAGMTDAECYKRANVDRKLFNKIKNQPDYRPGKATVLAFAVALRLPLPETRDMLAKAGFSLSHSSKFDLIVEYFLRKGVYDIYEINDALFSFDQKLLGSGI
ncbi:MAG: O-acetyl-ADP-ribose deacetylase [Clostridia bacterium]|nr:O-acetyl-ADP-ribose deacetylase [Clostridia bacterium]